jgi:putative RNA 2'-phosphotransferase
MSEEKELINKGKHLAFLLRHDEEAFNNGLIDEHGWRQVSELIKNHGYTKNMLDEIVETNNKQRYEYDEHKMRIRARQGHSIPVEVELTEVNDVKVLWHGTSDRFFDSIMREGLKPQSRLYVHLSKDQETAEIVGKRHGGKLRIIKIDAEQMIKDGEKIWISNNGVYLTKKVEPKYFIETIYG